MLDAPSLAWNEKVARARIYYLVVLLLVVPVVSSFHAVCFFLDGILFPGLRRVKVEAPIFMVGHARSGTTLTHRLMSQDTGRFSSFLLYECYFPSLLEKKLIRLGIVFDRRFLGGFISKRVEAWEERRYGQFRHMPSLSCCGSPSAALGSIYPAWEWRSAKPGHTTCPVASITWSASSRAASPR